MELQASQIFSGSWGSNFLIKKWFQKSTWVEILSNCLPTPTTMPKNPATRRFVCRGNKILTAALEVKDTLKHVARSMSCVWSNNFITKKVHSPGGWHGGWPDSTDQCEVKRKQEWHKGVSWENGVVVYWIGGDCRRRRYWRMRETKGCTHVWTPTHICNHIYIHIYIYIYI